MTDRSCRFFNRRFWLTIFALTYVANAAPSRSNKSKNSGPQVVIDQKQKGDYNIQLHLKDFQIIALLGDSDAGDYEYAYDYADFTVKPSSGAPSTPHHTTSTTTFRPPTSPSSTSDPSTATTRSPSYSTQKPFSTTAKPDQTYNSHQNEATSKPQKPSIIEESNSIENAVLISEFTAIKNPPPVSYTPLEQSSSTSHLKPSTEEPIVSMTPGKIKVQIMGEPSEVSDNSQPSGPLHIVPGEELGESEAAPVDDILKRCASGFTRDKKGRCRRVRRPGVSSQLPFGFSRFASNLASRLRLSPAQTSLDNSELSLS